MDTYTLSSATYGTSPRLAQRMKLNTIMEDETPREEAQACSLRRWRRRSDNSSCCNSNRFSSSTISSYYESSRSSQIFDDLYDVSGSESEPESDRPKINIKRASTGSTLSNFSTNSRNKYPPLAIPSPRHWPTIQKFKNSPVPPTPPAKIPLSPEMLSKIPPAPSSSATPSLDGSLSSDQMTSSISSPSTPDIERNPQRIEDWSLSIARASDDFGEETGPTIEVGMDLAELNSSVEQLPAAAMTLLQNLTIQIPEQSSTSLVHQPPEMREIACLVQKPESEVEPVSAASEYSISQLSIPSPGGFFSSLEANSRYTWSTNISSFIEPPSSTTAEHFYNAPWNMPSPSPQMISRIIDIDTDGDTTVGPMTARYAPTLGSLLSPRTDVTPGLGLPSPPMLSPPVSEAQRSLALEDIDRQLQSVNESAVDRAAEWAAAQSDFLNTLAGKSSSSSSDSESESVSTGRTTPETLLGKRRKTVKFLDTDKANAVAKAEATDSTFYHAFQTLSNQSSPTDSFVHRHSRFDAVQALRSSLRQTHIDSLLGRFATVSRKPRGALRPVSMFTGPNDTEEDEEALAQKEAIAQQERERQAFEQVAPAMWIVEGMRFLSGGRLLNCPGADVLSQAPPAPPMGSKIPPAPPVRVLDLGGQPQCDWAWHCAREYPHVRTYTATCDERAVNAALRGPRNHRLVRVDKLYQLPFPDNHFDVISARSLPTFLRAVATTASSSASSASQDEYDACLAECMRVLKPGGYLEFFIMDAALAQPGPKGEAASVEFAVNLKSRGYDPAPTRAWLRRVRGAGLVGIKRAWMFLPMGAIRAPETPLPETPPPESHTHAIGAAGAHFSQEHGGVEAVQGPVGSGADAAHVSGLVGSCLWERWMLKLQMEMGRQTGLLDGVGAVVEEGRQTGAGWRCMSGWAQKPVAMM